MSSREEFEDWYGKAYPGGLSTGVMKLAFEELAYASWQASRQALVVELPQVDTWSPRSDYAEAYKVLCAEAISSAGVRVKT